MPMMTISIASALGGICYLCFLRKIQSDLILVMFLLNGLPCINVVGPSDSLGVEISRIDSLFRDTDPIQIDEFHFPTMLLCMALLLLMLLLAYHNVHVAEIAMHQVQLLMHALYRLVNAAMKAF